LLSTAETSAAGGAVGKRQKSQTLPVLRYENYKLPNGLDVIFSEDHTLPLVSVNLWCHVGPANGRLGARASRTCLNT
jgi:hypothetical protein